VPEYFQGLDLLRDKQYPRTVGLYDCLRLDVSRRAVTRQYTGYKHESYFLITEHRDERDRILNLTQPGWEVYHIPSGMRVVDRIFGNYRLAIFFVDSLVKHTPDVDWNFKPDYRTYKIGDLNGVLNLGKAVREALKETDIAHDKARAKLRNLHPATQSGAAVSED